MFLEDLKQGGHGSYKSVPESVWKAFKELKWEVSSYFVEIQRKTGAVIGVNSRREGVYSYFRKYKIFCELNLSKAESS